jgi:gliding motility-associated-like protein
MFVCSEVLKNFRRVMCYNKKQTSSALSNHKKFLFTFFLAIAGWSVYAQAPTTGATNFSVTNIEGNSLRVDWTRGNGTSVLVIASTSPTFGGGGLPADGTDYTANSDFGFGTAVGGAGNFAVHEAGSTSSSVTVRNLTINTTYYFRIFEFNGTGPGTLYNTVNLLEGSGTTLAAPTVGATNLSVTTPIPGNSAQLNWTRGNGTRSLVILQAGSSPGDPTQLINYSPSTFFGSGSLIGASGRVVHFSVTSTVTVTNLEPNTTYFYRVVEANGTSGPVFNLATALTGSFTTGGAPTTPATNFTSTFPEGNRVQINWTRGNGSQVLVVASLSPTFNGGGLPANGTDYTANAAFGSGNPVGSNNFVVYEGAATGVSVTNLVLNTTYHFRVFEFNGTLSNTTYNTTSFLAGSATTLSPPTVGSTNLTTSLITGNSATLSWTAGNGTRRLVILQAGATPANPTDYTSYFGSSSFGSGSTIGAGHVIFQGTTPTTVNVTNLAPNTTYHYKVVEFNGSSGPVYDVTNALTGSFTTAGAPTVGSTVFSASGSEGASFSVSFTRGNGVNRLVVAREGAPVIFTPADGVDYNVSSTFGAGDNLGNNTFAIADGNVSGASLTGLTPATTYHIAVFEYNGSATNTFYLTTPAQILRGSATTISPPATSASALNFSAIDGHRATVSFTVGSGTSRIVLARAGAPVTDVPVNLVSYFGTGSFPSATVIGNSRVVYRGSGNNFTLSSLEPNTTYHFAVFEFNGSSSPIYKQVDPAIGSFITQGLPTAFPSNITFANLQGNSFTFNYNTGNGFGRIIIAKLGSPVDVFPTNNVSYTENSSFGSGANLGGGNFVIRNDGSLSTTSSTSISNLAIGQTYHFAIIEYNGTGTNRIYASAPAQRLVASQATLSQPTVQASNITFTAVTATGVTVNWQNGNGSNRMVIVREGQAVSDFPVNLSAYFASTSFPFGSAIGAGRVVYNGNVGSSVALTNMPPGIYHVAVVEYNGSSGGSVYRTVDPPLGQVLVGERPNAAASNLNFSGINGNSMSLNFTVGNGLSRLIIARQGSPVDAFPVDNTGYTASSTFGSGSNLGGGNFVVGIGSTGVSVTGLQPNTTYHFAVVEFNGSGSTALYQLSSTVARGSQTTLTAPTLATSNFFGTNTTGNSMNLSWTNGNGTNRMIIAKAGSAVDVLPVNLTGYFSSSSFGSGSNLGGGNFVVYNSSGDNFLLTNLQPATTYHFASFEYNGSGGGSVYLTSSIGRASFTTAARPSVAPRNLSVSSVNGDRFSVNFTAGNGTRRLIIARKGGLVNVVPSDLTTYTASAFGLGTQVGTGNFVVGITTSTGVTITGLEPNAEYGIAVFELDGSAGNERYLVTEFINQLARTSVTPAISTFSLLFNSIGSTTINLSWTVGNGEGRMVVLRPFQPVTFSPADLNAHGFTSTSFTSAGILIGDQRHIQRGNNTNVNITNLTPGTTYHVAIFEYNGSGQPVYTSIPLRGFFTTLPATGLAIGGFDAITFCPSQQVDVPYVFTGVLSPGNVVSIELSDITGSFATPLVLGIQSTTNASGFVTSILPTSLPEGLGYRLRVRATNPASVSPNNGADLQIATSVQPTFSVVGGVNTSCGTPIQLITSQPNYNLQWFRNGTPISGATSSSHLATETGDYQVRIAGASGGCQLLSTATTLTITPEPTFNFLLADSYCLTEVVDLAPLSQPAGGILSGTGVLNGVFTAATAGVGQHLINYTYVDPVSLCSFTTTTQIRVVALPPPPTAIGASGCQLTNLALVASGANIGESYRWYTVASGGSPIAGATLAAFTTPPLTATTSYYVSIVSEGGCEGPRAEVVATVATVTKPAITTSGSPSFCTSGSIVLTAPVGFTSYEWSTGETTPSITVTAAANYTVRVRNASGCESEVSDPVTVTINQPPPKPQIAVTGNLAICAGQSTTLSAPNGFTYSWSTGATTQSITVTAAANYTVRMRNASGCESEVSDPVTVTINQPPPTPQIVVTGDLAICAGQSTTLSAPSGFTYSWSTGATTQEIVVTTADTFSVTIADANSCSATSATVATTLIDCVTDDLIVYNAISPNADLKNEKWIIENIDARPDTQQNQVTIYNRWGDVVWEGKNYDNTTVVFTGLSKGGSELPSGTYFYKIDFSQRGAVRGFLILKR